MKELMKKLVVEEEGQGMVEYGLIVGLVSVVVVTLLSTIGTNIKGYFQSIVDAM